jgi:hypothetical protein
MQVATAREGERDAYRPGGPPHAQMKTQREKSEEKRQAKLEAIREQVDGGTLVIRPMTPAERKLYPPRPVERRRSNRQ